MSALVAGCLIDIAMLLLETPNMLGDHGRAAESDGHDVEPLPRRESGDPIRMLYAPQYHCAAGDDVRKYSGGSDDRRWTADETTGRLPSYHSAHRVVS